MWSWSDDAKIIYIHKLLFNNDDKNMLNVAEQ